MRIDNIPAARSPVCDRKLADGTRLRTAKMDLRGSGCRLNAGDFAAAGVGDLLFQFFDVARVLRLDGERRFLLVVINIYRIGLYAR